VVALKVLPRALASDAHFTERFTREARALDAIEAEQASVRQFEVLKPWLNGEAVDVSQSAAAAELGISEGAVKLAIHRLRKRFRERVRREIAETVAGPDEIKAELDYLIEVLGEGAG
jgi:RNA polymerase sigma-70 factor (ECF subfamily)